MSTPNNPLLLPETEDHLIADMKNLLSSKHGGKLHLKNYLDLDSAGACVDFGEVYETSDELREVIQNAIRHGANIEIEEDAITVL